MSRPTVADLTGDHKLAVLARQHWLTKTPQKVLPETVRQIWDAVQKDADAPFCLLLLEQLQALERYLWPTYDDDASNQHVLLLAYLCNVKRQEHLPVWTLFADRPDEFSSFFQRVTRLSIDGTVDIRAKTHLLSFLVGAFQSLDNGLVRKECAPLVSIGIWQELHSDEAREKALARNTQLQKAWRSSQKKLQGLDQVGQIRVKLERSWLFTALLDFLNKLYQTEVSAKEWRDDLRHCERFLELLCDFQSQLPTRRYVNALLQDVNVLSAIRLSPLYQDGDDAALLREMHNLLQHYTYFPIDDQSGRQMSRTEYDAARNASIANLQNVALKQQPEKLKILVLANYGSLAQREELLGHLRALSDVELLNLCSAIGLRTSYPSVCQVVVDRAFLEEVMASTIEARPYFSDTVQDNPILPTERTLYDPRMLRTDDWDGSRPLPIPKLNLQYLTLGDFLWRAYTLYRSEAFYGVRKHLGDTVKRLQPSSQGNLTRFDGFSRMAIPIGKPAVVEVTPPEVGELVPAEVRVEVILDVSRLQPGLRREWESLRPDDVVFLVAVQPAENEQKLTNGNPVQPAAERAGVKAVRSAQVMSVLDENSRVLRFDQDRQDQIDGLTRARQRRLLLRLDAMSYQADKERADVGKGDVLDSINVIIRRRSRENNFKPVLDTLKQLVQSETVPVPTWLQDVFLGYGDPASASYKRLPNRPKSIDYRDTFVDWQHLIESLPSKAVEPDPKADASFAPPYVLESIETAAPVAPAPKPSKKRKREQPDGAVAAAVETVRVSTYQPPNAGPYLTDAPKANQVRFTPAQIEAITSGTQPGLTVIVGPPGTGKTDVTTQIISNIYRNFPQQRTLLVAHSNQALNQLFQKITKLDIDERHLLRLGHGEEELETEASFGKAGRVESFLERGGQYLAEVQRLAASINAPGAHGSSCETAEYFDQVWVQPRWRRYWDEVRAGADVVIAFPFSGYFANAPQPLFPTDASGERQVDIAKGCERHMRRIFDELAEIRPFEILRSQRDKSNYLLVREARIIAMTSTHAAIRRQEIANLGFKYDNVIMEEAAQVTEAESFIPFVLQDPAKSSTSSNHSLQRIVLVGDHLQNSPVIQNVAFRSYANLEQSLFQRLIRLGVPHINLDAQGRSRPTIAALCRWRYPSLSNLPFTSTAAEFVQANAGFRYDYQFVDVPDYKGKGETEPSPHFIQNLGEAEYAVALYQYMRLLGYPAEKITILTAYAGQRALIRDVLTHRCKNNRLFGMPGWVGTVDKYQGEQNDYVILSMVRTKTPGYLRDVRRLTVALSRARLGLYVLGRREVFESSLELREAFALLFERPTKLALVTGEMFPTSRLVEAKVERTDMEGVEHLGQYVYEMTQAKVKALKEGGGVLPPAASGGRVEEDGEGEGDDEAVENEVDEDF
ncbi:P-loop containing nucleoside triphosphate hydrolase protein [Teratosphaeria nubilosa]|uniref:Pre-mRNA-splicing factor n=1 Tax=Teratosphaeria nubilosa TaxID=161662 RepID=A0A6G1LIM4_9PEZI|nr:P-loop containing nucleoside triphosphate hydrolase protein [Teratosphaeria nubilosa]